MVDSKDDSCSWGLESGLCMLHRWVYERVLSWKVPY